MASQDNDDNNLTTKKLELISLLQQKDYQEALNLATAMQADEINEFSPILQELIE